jgi:hypothetical protein
VSGCGESCGYVSVEGGLAPVRSWGALAGSLDQQVSNLHEKEPIGPRLCDVSLWEPLPKSSTYYRNGAQLKPETVQ